MRRLALAGVVTVLSLAGPSRPLPAPTPGAVFALQPDCPPNQLRNLALDIYKTGWTAKVEATDRRGHYRLFNRRPGNLIEVEAIRRRLLGRPCVLAVQTVTGYFFLEADESD